MMITFNPIKYGIFLGCLLLLVACGNKRYLEREKSSEKNRRWAYQERLVVNNRINFKKQTYPISDKTDLEDNLADLILQEPNEKIVTFRWRLWVHNIFRGAQEEEDQFRYWLKTRIGEEPAIYSTERTKRTATSMQYFLNSRGYFNAKVAVDTTFRQHKAKVIYNIEAGRPLLIDSIFLRSADPQMQAILDSSQKASYLRPGMPIRKNTFLNEKSRLLLEIRNSGYEEFDLNYIYFEADTTGKSLGPNPSRSATPKANVYVHILPLKDSMPHQAYRLNRIYIYPNEETLLLGQGEDSLRRDTQVYEGLHIVRWEEKGIFLRNSVLREAVAFEANELYHYTNYRKTLLQLGELDVFTPPDVDFYSVKGDSGLLDVHIRMQAANKIVFGADVDVNTDNANLGGALNLLFRHRNVFKGAEIFMFNVEGGADFILIPGQTVGEDNRGLARWINMVDLNGEMRLYFPKYIGIIPRFDSLLQMEKVRSRISLGARYLQQSTDFSVRSFYGRYGYEWIHTKWHSFTFNPVLANITLEPRLSTDFRNQLEDNNPALLLSLRERFVILGLDFSHTYSSAIERGSENIWSLRSNFESSGVALSALDALVKPDTDFQPFNIRYSEYLRLEVEGRFAHIFGDKHRLATRLVVGSAFSLNPNRRIPFSRRFFLGGPNSMRAWRMRTLGPGEVRPVESAAFQLGDFRLEANAEYRLKLGGYFEGALFFDVGNIWDLRQTEAPAAVDPPNVPAADGLLKWDFLTELAFCGGLGLRIDLDFVVLRLDWALQLRSPYPYDFDTQGFPRHWNWNPIEFSQRNNLVLGVGYPF